MRAKCFVSVSSFLVVAATLAALGYYSLAPMHGINEHAFTRIQVGMTPCEVEQVIGLPAGDHQVQHGRFSNVKSCRLRGTQQKWTGDDGVIFVWFDENGTVMDKEFVVPSWDSPGWFTKFVNAIGTRR